MDIASLQMTVVLLLTAALIFAYVTEIVPIEVSSLALVSVLLLLFSFWPVQGPDGENLLDARELLAGFGNPALIAVLALLMVGDGLVRTGALDSVAEMFADRQQRPALTAIVAFSAVAVFSAFLNNTPIVVIFIPILQAVALSAKQSASRWMMPLSFAAILGGMTTLIGSSTNLLVSSTMREQGLQELSFFEITPIAVILAGAGLVYVIFVLPRLMPERSSGSLNGREADGRHYIGQFVVSADSPLVGEAPLAGRLQKMPDVTLLMIRSRGVTRLPQMDDTPIESGDIIVFSAQRKVVEDLATRQSGLFHPPIPFGQDRLKDRISAYEAAVGLDDPGDEAREGDEGQLLVEAMIVPSSRLVGLSVSQYVAQFRHRSLLLGVRRRANMGRAQLEDVRLASGDVLLLKGRRPQIDAMRQERDLVLISGTTGNLPRRHHAKTALAIFLTALALAASGVIPIVAAAVGAATLMIAVGCLTVREAMRALDRKVVLIVAASLALGTALSATGGAAFVADLFIALFGQFGPTVLLSGFFLLVAIFTNILSNNACAVLFTPIAVSLAVQAGIDPRAMAMTVLLAANCSFASPIGYQTNLLVMGPGRYNFVDYVKAGLPLMLILWLTFTLAAPMVWQL